MAYPEKGVKYAGQDRAAKMCRAEGGEVSAYPNKIPGLTDEQIRANNARRPANWDDQMDRMYQSKSDDTNDNMMGKRIDSDDSLLKGKTPL